MDKYKNYLLSEKWQKIKASIWARDSGECQICGSAGSDVHHITYVRFGNEKLSDLVLLCRSCHRSEHTYKVFLGKKKK